MKHAVFIRKEWKGSKIKVTVDDVEIAIQMTLEEYLTALILEAKSPATVLTKAGLEKLVRAASDRVIHKMKEETAKVM